MFWPLHFPWMEWWDCQGEGSWKKFTWLPGLVFLEMLGVGWSLGFVPVNQAEEKSLCKRTFFFWGAEGVSWKSLLWTVGSLCSCCPCWTAESGMTNANWSGLPLDSAGSFWSQGEDAVLLIWMLTSRLCLKILVCWVWSLEDGRYKTFGIQYVSLGRFSLEQLFLKREQIYDLNTKPEFED